MSETEILNYIGKLDWKHPKSVQKNAIKTLIKTDDKYLPLIFDKTRKSTWENAVKVIKEIRFPRNKIFVNDLIWLLQDLNWPGATDAVSVLSCFDEEYVISSLVENLKKADSCGDTMWIGGMKYLIETNNYKSEILFAEDIRQILEKADF